MKNSTYKNICIYSLVAAVIFLFLSIFLSAANNVDGATVLGIVSSLCCIIGLFSIFKYKNKKDL